MKEKLTERIQELSLTIFSNEIKSIFTKNSTKTACRIYKEGKIGIAGCIGETNINELYNKAEQKLESNKMIEACSELMTAHSKLLTLPKEPLPLILEDYWVTQKFL